MFMPLVRKLTTSDSLLAHALLAVHATLRLALAVSDNAEINSPSLPAQVGVIKSTQVDIENTMKDQADLRKEEDKKVRHWTREIAKKRDQMAATFPEGAAQHPRQTLSQVH